MGENIGLLCAESTTTCFGDFDCNANFEFGISSSSYWHELDNQNQNQVSFFDNNCLKSSFMIFPIHSEERFREMVEREIKHLPKQDYLWRLRIGDLDLSGRNEAFDWIIKVQTHYDFGPVSVCLSMNYLDRFLSVYNLPKDKAWSMQLLAVACLSIATKLEEINVPLSVDLQVGEPKYVFEAKTIQRMELLVLCTLKWRMQAITPCSYLDYFLSKINGNQNVPTSLITRSLQLIQSIIKGIDLLEFRQSEIAAAVAIFATGKHPDFTHIEKDRVIKIVEVIKDISMNSRCVSVSSVAESPNGVLDVAAAAAAACLCLSYKSDDITTTTTTVGSCAVNSSSHNNTPHSHIKRRRKLQEEENNNSSPLDNNSSSS